MPTYVSLLEFTQDGVESIEDLPTRDEEGTSLLSSMGVEITDHYYTLGQYDEVVVCEAPDDETVARGMLAIASEGNVSTETLRAFSEDDFHDLVGGI